MKRSETRSVVATLTGLLASNGAILACGVGTGVLVARWLSPADRGTLATLALWPQILGAIGLLSLNESMVLRLSARGVRLGAAIAGAVWAASLLAVLTCVGGWLVLPHLLGERTEVLPLARWFLILFVPANFLALLFLTLDTAKRDFHIYNRLRLLGPSVYLAALLVLLSLGRLNLSTAAIASLSGSILVTLLCLYRHRTALLHRTNVSELVALVQTSAGIHGTALLSLVSAQMDRIAVAVLLGPVALGFYSVAITISGSLLGVIATTSQSFLFPEIALSTEPGTRRFWLQKGLGGSTLAVVLTTAVLCCSCPLLLVPVFGPEYRPSVIPAFFAILAYAPFCLRQIAVRCLRATGRAWPGNWSEITSILCFVAFVVPAARYLGLSGVCLALGLSNSLGLVVCASELKRSHQLEPRAWMLPNGADLRRLHAWAVGRWQTLAA